MKGLSILLLSLGFLWFLFNAWMFASLAGIAEPESIVSLIAYWGGMLLGPVALITGSIFMLRKILPIYGAVLISVGCLVFSAFVLHTSIEGLQPKPLEMPPLYSFYVVLLVIMVLADLAAYKLCRLVSALSKHDR